MAYLGMKFLRHKFSLLSLRSFLSTSLAYSVAHRPLRLAFWGGALLWQITYFFCLAAYGRLFLSRVLQCCFYILVSFIFSWHMVAIFIVQIQILFHYRKNFLLLYHLLLVFAFLFCPLFHECQLFLFIYFYSSHFHLFIFLCV